MILRQLAHLVDAVQRLWVGRLPRKAPNKVVEHRISLSNLERDYAKQYLANQRLGNFTSLSTGAGVVALGAGAVYGVYVLSKWLGVGDIFDNIKQTPARLKQAVELLLSDRAILYYITRFPMGRKAFERIKREMQEEYAAYRLNRSKLEAEYTKFGDPASNYYDAQEAARIEAEISALDEQFTQLQERAKEALDAAVQRFRDNVPLF